MAPAAPPIPGSSLEGVADSDIMLEEVNMSLKSLVIIGGGVIGMEFAQIYSDIGCQVTVLEAMDRILHDLFNRELDPMYPYLTYQDFLSACGLTEEDLTLD